MSRPAPHPATPAARRRSRRVPIAVASLAAALAVAACAGEAEEAGADVNALVATVGDAVAVDVGALAVASEDGRTMITGDGCVVTVGVARPDTTADVRCPPDAPTMSPADVAYAPNGSQLVGTLDLLGDGAAPDLVVLDLVDLSSRTLTDGADAAGGAAPGGSLDVLPVFAAADRVTFLRVDPADDRSRLVTVDLDGQEIASRAVDVAFDDVASTRAAHVAGRYTLLTADTGRRLALTSIDEDGTTTTVALPADVATAHLGSVDRNRRRLVIHADRSDGRRALLVWDGDAVTDTGRRFAPVVDTWDLTGQLLAGITPGDAPAVLLHDTVTARTVRLTDLPPDEYVAVLWPTPDLIVAVTDDSVVPIDLRVG